MMTTLKQKDFEDFWIRVYFHTSQKDKLLDAVVKRSYRDFGRTLHGINQSIEGKDKLIKIIKNAVHENLETRFDSQDSFDEWHKEKCFELITGFKDILNHKLYVGQSQKWINMTFKYLFALGDDRIKNISRNYIYFHIPIDNLIQDKLSNFNIPNLKEKWSRIDRYSDYLQYQKLVRENFIGKIPMDIEFNLFNE